MGNYKGLSPKQEEFCHVYLRTMNASQAYREVYKPKPTTKENTIGRRAKDLMDHGKIKARMEELRAPALEAVGLTLTSHLQKLAELRDKAMDDSNWSAAIQAEHHRGKAAGLYTTKVEGQVDTRHSFTCILTPTGHDPE